MKTIFRASKFIKNNSKPNAHDGVPIIKDYASLTALMCDLRITEYIVTDENGVIGHNHIVVDEFEVIENKKNTIFFKENIP